MHFEPHQKFGCVDSFRVFFFFQIVNAGGLTFIVKGTCYTKFWYGVMNLVQMNILEACVILQYPVIVLAVEIES